MNRKDKRIWVENMTFCQTHSPRMFAWLSTMGLGAPGRSEPISTDWNLVFRKNKMATKLWVVNIHHSRIPIVLLPFCEAAWQNLRFNHRFLFLYSYKWRLTARELFRGTLEFVYFEGFVAKRVVCVVIWWLTTDSCTRGRLNRIDGTTSDRFHGEVSKLCKKLRFYHVVGVKGSLHGVYWEFVLATTADMWAYAVYIKQLKNWTSASVAKYRNSWYSICQTSCLCGLELMASLHGWIYGCHLQDTSCTTSWLICWRDTTWRFFLKVSIYHWSKILSWHFQENGFKSWGFS